MYGGTVPQNNRFVATCSQCRLKNTRIEKLVGWCTIRVGRWGGGGGVIRGGGGGGDQSRGGGAIRVGGGAVPSPPPLSPPPPPPHFG